jgi:hypothetical protein
MFVKQRIAKLPFIINLSGEMKIYDALFVVDVQKIKTLFFYISLEGTPSLSTLSVVVY